MVARGLTLPDFLLARIAEEERAAEAADDAANVHFFTPGHTVERVLADCEERRQVVEGWRHVGIRALPLRVMAVFYANHPDFREEWRP